MPRTDIFLKEYFMDLSIKFVFDPCLNSPLRCNDKFMLIATTFEKYTCTMSFNL